MAFFSTRLVRYNERGRLPSGHMIRIGIHAHSRPSLACLLWSVTAPRRKYKPRTVHMGLASLCNSNRVHFMNRTLRSVYGRGSHAIRSSSSSAFANPLCRHTSPLPPQGLARPFPISASRGHPNARTLSWAAKFNLRPRPPSTSRNDADANEEVTKEAVLEAIKGRQQTDLMLRCESLVHRDMVVSQTCSNSSLHRHHS
jgi:hypothetical protein